MPNEATNNIAARVTAPPDGENHPRPVFLQPCTGVTLQPNGDVLFRFKTEPGAAVTVSVGNDFKKAITIDMQDPQNDGLYEAIFPEQGLAGPQRVIFRANGFEILNTAAPVWYYANSLSNYVEFPDPETDALIAARPNIPHGAITHDFFYSKSFGRFMSSVVYTPPGYEEGGEYPVLYFFHEVAENQTAWTDAARMNFLLDNLIAEGKCKPFIVVENDSTVRLDYHDQPDWFADYDKLEHFILEDCEQFIASKYRIKDGKWNRAMSGIGLGAIQAAYIGMRNTDFFGSIGLFTSFWPSNGFHAEGKDDPIYDGAEYIGKHPDAVKVFYVSEGNEDMHFKGMLQEVERLAELKVTDHPGYVFKVYQQTHNWGSYRRSFRDFAPLLFRD